MSTRTNVHPDRTAEIAAWLSAARAAQRRWAATPVKDRLKVLRAVRHRIAAQPERLLESLATRTNRDDLASLTAEILPLADAGRFLERNAAALLAPRRLGRNGRPAWLFAIDAEIRREPLGVVLVVGPANYPLFLAGVQTLQALAAGNAVVVKPAPGCSAPMARFAEMLWEVGVPEALCRLLAEDVEEVERVLDDGVDHVVLTGSATTGRAVLAMLAPKLVSATLELSGNDAVYVLADADLDAVADALAFGMRLNGGATCIAPRRVFVPAVRAADLETKLAARLAGALPVSVPPPVRARLASLLDEADRSGARFLPKRPTLRDAALAPTVVLDADPAWGLLKEDISAPILSLVRVQDMDEALDFDARCPYALGASIFGSETLARRLADRVRAGSVTVNDLIAPTADPRLPFGGRGRSGFGVTRGAEGLLALTTVKTVAVRGGRFRPHHRPPDAAQRQAAEAYLRAAHGAGLKTRLRATHTLVRALIRSARS